MSESRTENREIRLSGDRLHQFCSAFEISAKSQDRA